MTLADWAELPEEAQIPEVEPGQVACGVEGHFIQRAVDDHGHQTNSRDGQCEACFLEVHSGAFVRCEIHGAQPRRPNTAPDAGPGVACPICSGYPLLREAMLARQRSLEAVSRPRVLVHKPRAIGTTENPASAPADPQDEGDAKAAIEARQKLAHTILLGQQQLAQMPEETEGPPPAWYAETAVPAGA